MSQEKARYKEQLHALQNEKVSLSKSKANLQLQVEDYQTQLDNHKKVIEEIRSQKEVLAGDTVRFFLS